MLRFYGINQFFGLAYHSIVLIIKLFHTQNVVAAGLLGKLETLLDLLVCPLFQEKHLFLYRFNLRFKF